MRSPFNFIVEPLDGKRYDNIVKIGDVEVYTNTDIEDFTSTQRLAIVVATPVGYDGPISDDAIVVLHHNVFRLMYDIKGKEVSSASYIRENTFFVEPDRIYLYKNDWAEDWSAVNDWCFVKPIKEDSDMSNSSRKELYGEMVYPSKHAESLGVSSGDLVVFEPEMEYEFTVDGELMYRVNSKYLCLAKEKHTGSI